MKEEDAEILEMYKKAVDNVIDYISDSDVIQDLDIIINLVNDSNVDYLYYRISDKLVELSERYKVYKPKFLQ